MVKVTDKDYYMDGYLKENLDTAKKAIKDDWDMVFTVDGAEGSGKSVLAMQMAYYVDPTFSEQRMAYSPKQFESLVLSAGKYQAIVYDEAFTGLLSRNIMSQVNVMLVQMIAEIRQRNLFVFIVMPTFFDLDRYVAIWRSRALVHVYTKGFGRGRFALFNAERKKQLYVNGKKFYSYAKPRANFHGRFTNYYPIDEQKYRDVKDTALKARQQTSSNRVSNDEFLYRAIAQFEEMDTKIMHKIRAEFLKLPLSTYYDKLKRFKEFGQ